MSACRHGIENTKSHCSVCAPETIRALREDLAEARDLLGTSESLKVFHEENEAALLAALEMVRDADDDCGKDGLPRIPGAARAAIDAAIARAGK